MIGERLSELRCDRGLTQDELGELLHLKKHNISAYERGQSEAPDDAKIAIAQFFGVSVDYLLGLTDRPTPYEKPHNCIYLDKNFPEDLKTVVQTLVHLLSYYSRKNPKTVSAELERMTQALLRDVCEDDSEPAQTDPSSPPHP